MRQTKTWLFGAGVSLAIVVFHVAAGGPRRVRTAQPATRASIAVVYAVATTGARGSRLRTSGNGAGSHRRVLVVAWSHRTSLRALDELRRVTQGEIVSNERLRAVLSRIQADQRERDLERRASATVRLREKRQIWTARARADAPQA